MDKKTVVFWNIEELKEILERKELINIKWMNCTEKGIEAEIK